MTLKYYLIHGLDKKREEIMKKEFDLWEFPKEDIKWILTPNKEEITEELINFIIIQYPSISCNVPFNPSYMILRKGYVACTFKHYIAIKDIVNNNYEYGVVMEDNIVFTGCIPKLIEIYIKQLNELYPDWDILFNGSMFRYIENPTKDNIYVYPKKTEITEQCHGATNAATFYVIRNKCAQKILPHYLPFNTPVDWWMNELFRKLDIKVYWTSPSSTRVQENHISTANTIT